MQIDETSFNDIAIFNQEEDFSLFHKLNFTRTDGGRHWLRSFFQNPYNDIQKIKGTQDILRKLIQHVADWPLTISNGTMTVLYKFLDYPLDEIARYPNEVNAFFYRAFHASDYSMVKFSMKHFTDFLHGVTQIRNLLAELDLPAHFKFYIDAIARILRIAPFQELTNMAPDALLSKPQLLYFARHFREVHKQDMLELMDMYCRLDAWYSMAVAVKTYGLSFPEFVEQEAALLSAKGLYHLLVPHAVPYDLQMDPQQNFVFLTGANMAGKSTLIKSVGAAVFLAHIGMGVPAAAMKMTLFDGLISNVNVMDNIVKGESYFYNEVQRIKNTVERISNGQKWLVLIDELFKGTNIEDAMKCSLEVVNGFVKVKNSLFILSTHLYEIGHELKDTPNISFKYFETSFEDDALSFSYHLKDGISNDRLGYVILRKEGVVDLLRGL